MAKSVAMDIKRFQAIEKQLAEQAEANCITNENLANLFQMMSARESKNIVPTPPALTPAPHPITTIPKASQPSRIRPCAPNDFDGVMFHINLTSELLIMCQSSL
jgi:hypothetical protein